MEGVRLRMEGGEGTMDRGSKYYEERAKKTKNRGINNVNGGRYTVN